MRTKVELHSQYHEVELDLEEVREGKHYKAKLVLKRNDVDDRSNTIATCHSLAEFLLIVPEGQRDGTVRPAYDVLLTKLGFLHGAITDIRDMARAGRRDCNDKHSVVGTFVAT